MQTKSGHPGTLPEDAHPMLMHGRVPPHHSFQRLMLLSYPKKRRKVELQLLNGGPCSKSRLLFMVCGRTIFVCNHVDSISGVRFWNVCAPWEILCNHVDVLLKVQHLTCVLSTSDTLKNARPDLEKSPSSNGNSSWTEWGVPSHLSSRVSGTFEVLPNSSGLANCLVPVGKSPYGVGFS